MRQKDEQESFHPILPSHQTRQRPFQAMDMEYLIRVIFVLVGMDTIAILVDLPKVGGLPMNSIFRTRSFDYRKRRFFCKRQGVYTVHCTAHVSHTQTFLARGARLKLRRFGCLNKSHSCAHVMFRTLLELAPFSSTLSTPTSSSSSSSSSSLLLSSEHDKSLCTETRTLVWPFCRRVSQIPAALRTQHTAKRL